MLFKSNKLVGLDIGTSTIKLVEVEGTGKKITLTAFGYVPTPQGAISNGNIVDTAALSVAIEQLLQQTGSKSKKAVVGVSGSSIITKKISIPRIDDQLLAEQLKWEAEQYIPFDINEINLGYHILANVPSPPEQMNILLVGAKRELVTKYAEVVEGAGLGCSIVDVTGFALANCYEANYGMNKGQTIGLLSMGAAFTQFVVLEYGEVTFCREILFGGGNYTQDIQKVMSISAEEAESMKISASQGQAVPQEVTDCIKQTNEAAAEEVRRILDFLMTTGTDINISKFYVTGGGFGVSGLTGQLSSVLGVEVEILNCFQNIRFDPAQFAADYVAQIGPYVAVGLGLAMRQGG